MTQQPPQPSFIHKKRRNLKGGKKTTHTLLLSHRARFPCPGAHSGGTGLEEVTGSQWEGRGGGCQGEEMGREGNVVGGCMSPPWWVPGEPGGAQGQLLGSRVGLCSGHSQGGEEGEVCAAGAHSLGGNVGTPHGPRARHKLQNNLFPVTHSWGPASSPLAPLTPVVAHGMKRTPQGVQGARWG